MAIAAPSTASGGSTPGFAGPGAYLGVSPLGVNTAAWDGQYSGASATTINGELKAAGLGLIRYPGGSWADEYDWSNNTDWAKCGNGPITASCASPDSVGFDTFSAQAHAGEAGTFVTVNYGSGSPALAAGWVSHARTTPGDHVALWEVGNESYGCFETNRHLADYPTYVEGYVPDGPVCPSEAVMAQSYAANAMPYLLSMHQADPTARIGVPWAFTAAEAVGSQVPDASTWNDTVLSSLGEQIGFVDAHWYPFGSVAGLTDTQVVDSVERIPAAAAEIRAGLGRYAPHAGFVIGETNISNGPTTLAFQPVAALFSAATSLEWISQGAQSVDWWDMNNYGSPTGGDYGLLSSGGSEAPADTPLAPYYGEELASLLAQPGSHVTTLDTGSPSVLGFASDGPGGTRELLVNTDTANPATVDVGPFGAGRTLATETYSPATAATATPIAKGSTSGATVTLPAESIVELGAG